METKGLLKGFAFGGIAGSIAETATFPLDVIKTRMQLQGELGAHRQYRSTWDAATKIVRSEGVTALYKVGRCSCCGRKLYTCVLNCSSG